LSQRNDRSIGITENYAQFRVTKGTFFSIWYSVRWRKLQTVGKQEEGESDSGRFRLREAAGALRIPRILPSFGLPRGHFSLYGTVYIGGSYKQLGNRKKANRIAAGTLRILRNLPSFGLPRGHFSLKHTVEEVTNSWETGRRRIG
jgi:hypothetical protein